MKEEDLAATPETEWPPSLRSVGWIMKSRPILFVGYGIHEIDIDVVAALHKHSGDDVSRYTLAYRQSDTADRHEEERLRQMGVRWWSFDLPAVAFSKLPGELSETRDHEWRRGPHASDESLRSDLDNRWRVQLQKMAASEWMNAQLEKLRDLLGDEEASAQSEAASDGERPRLVVAGLASQWYAFALKRASDFPSRRRVSAGLAAVDSRVPGGSGLVPVMVAAAVAGPDAVGRLAFLTNTPEAWSGWREIEEFCLSAGIDVRPLRDPPADAGARTSHVLLFDPDEKEDITQTSRQRMIMDVDRLVDLSAQEKSDAAEIRAPMVSHSEGFGTSSPPTSCSPTSSPNPH